MKFIMFPIFLVCIGLVAVTPSVIDTKLFEQRQQNGLLSNLLRAVNCLLQQLLLQPVSGLVGVVEELARAIVAILQDIVDCGNQSNVALSLIDCIIDVITIPNLTQIVVNALNNTVLVIRNSTIPGLQECLDGLGGQGGLGGLGLGGLGGLRGI